MQLDISFCAKTNFEILFEEQHFDVDQSSQCLTINYKPKFQTRYNLIVRCSNPMIRSNHVEITKLQFDNFWCLEGNKVAIAKNVYDIKYMEYAKIHNIEIDYTVENNNLLFFTGNLVYTFYHPITDFIHALH